MNAMRTNYYNWYLQKFIGTNTIMVNIGLGRVFILTYNIENIMILEQSYYGMKHMNSKGEILY